MLYCHFSNSNPMSTLQCLPPMGFHRHFLPTSIGLLQPLRPLACTWDYPPVTKLRSCLLRFTLKTKASLAVLITDMWGIGGKGTPGKWLLVSPLLVHIPIFKTRPTKPRLYSEVAWASWKCSGQGESTGQ